MAQAIECACGTRLLVPSVGGDAVCPRCGAEHTLDAALVPEVVWAEEGDRNGPRELPRTAPPRFAEARADEVYTRVAGGTRVRRRPRPAWRAAAVGVGLILVAAVVSVYRLDLPFLHIPSAGLAVIGLAMVLKMLMGYGR